MSCFFSALNDCHRISFSTQQTLHDLLKNAPLAYAAEIKELNQQHESLFSKWMLQLQ